MSSDGKALTTWFDSAPRWGPLFSLPDARERLTLRQSLVSCGGKIHVIVAWNAQNSYLIELTRVNSAPRCAMRLRTSSNF